MSVDEKVEADKIKDEALKGLDKETDAIFREELVFEHKVNGKLLWIKELSLKDRKPFASAWLKIIKRAYDYYKLCTDTNADNMEKIMQFAAEDLDKTTQEDFELIIMALKPFNQGITAEDLLELTQSELKELMNKVLEINGLNDYLKKVIPSGLTVRP